jgi:hypothetical protein
MDYFLEASAFLSSAFAGLAGFASLLASALGASFFLANFISSFGASALAGAAGAVAAGAGVAGLAAGVAVWANAVNDNADRITIANVFILSFLYVNEVDFFVYMYITP